MTEDLTKRRQLLKDRLEGKSTEILSPPSLKQTKVKNNPTRLHIPTIFQLNKSTENISAAPKISSQNINISKSTGNIYKDSSLRLANFDESTTKAPSKPPRKLSTSFCMKIDDGKSNEDLTKSSQNESKLRFSRSFSVTKSSENTAVRNYGELEKKERNFSVSSEDLDREMKQDEREVKINTNPVIISSIRKKHSEETNVNLPEKENVTATNGAIAAATEEGLVMLRKKLSDLRVSKTKIASIDSLPTLNFNFTDQNRSPTAITSPDSPILKKLEKHPNLKRSGSRAGFIVREEIMEQKEENIDNDEDPLYDNLQLKNTPVQNEKQYNDIGVDNKEKINTDTADMYDNVKLENTPLRENIDKPRQNDFTNKDGYIETKKTDEVLLKNEDFEQDNFLYGKFDDIQCEKEEIKKELHEKYSNISNEVLYENMEVLRANNYYSKKFLLGPVYKNPLPTKRSAYSN